MATETPKLKLRKADLPETVSLELDLRINFDKIDANPGIFVCTSGTRPPDASNWSGRVIYEEDTDRYYMWRVVGALTSWLFLGGQIPYARTAVAAGAGITIANNVETDLLLKREFEDTDNHHDNAVNSQRLTCKIPGLYDVEGFVEWEGNVNGQRITLLRWTRGASTETLIKSREWSLPPQPVYNHIHHTLRLNENDYIVLNVRHTAGADLKVLDTSRFIMKWVGR